MDVKSYRELLRELLSDTAFGRNLGTDGTLECAEPQCEERVPLPEGRESAVGFRITSGSEEGAEKQLVAWCLEHVKEKTPKFCECLTQYSYTKEEDGFLLSCDVCSEWFHGHCVGVGDDEDVTSFVCSHCKNLSKTGSVISASVKEANAEKDRISEEMNLAMTFFRRVDTLHLWMKNVRDVVRPIDEGTAKAIEDEIRPLNLSLQRWIVSMPDGLNQETLVEHLDLLTPEEASDDTADEDVEDDVLVLPKETYPLSSYGIKNAAADTEAALRQLLKDVDDWEDAAVNLITRFRLLCKADVPTSTSSGRLRDDLVPKLTQVLKQIVAQLARRPSTLIIPKHAQKLARCGDEIKWLLNAHEVSLQKKPTSAEVLGITGQASSWAIANLPEVSAVYQGLVERANVGAEWQSRYSDLLRACTAKPAVKILGDVTSLGENYKGVLVEKNVGANGEDAQFTVEDVRGATADMDDAPVRIVEKERLQKALDKAVAWIQKVDDLADQRLKEGGAPASSDELLTELRSLCEERIAPLSSFQGKRQLLALWWEAVRWCVLSRTRSRRYSQSTGRAFLDQGASILENVTLLPENAPSRIQAAFEELRTCKNNFEAEIKKVDNSPGKAAALAKLETESILGSESRDEVAASLSILQHEPFITPEEEGLQLVADLPDIEKTQSVLCSRETTLDRLLANQSALTQKTARIDELLLLISGSAEALKALKGRLQTMLVEATGKVQAAEKLTSTAKKAVRVFQTGGDDEGKYSKRTLEAILASAEQAKLTLNEKTADKLRSLIAGADAWESKAQELLQATVERRAAALTEYRTSLEGHIAASKGCPASSSTREDIKAALQISSIAMAALELLEGDFDSERAKPLLRDIASAMQASRRLSKLSLFGILGECYCEVAVKWVEGIVNELRSPTPDAKRRSSAPLVAAQKFFEDAGKSLPSPCAEVAGRFAGIRGYTESMQILKEQAKVTDAFRPCLARAEASFTTELFLNERILNESDSPPHLQAQSEAQGQAQTVLLLTAKTVQNICAELSKTPYQMAEEERGLIALKVIGSLSNFLSIVIGMSPRATAAGPQLEIQQLRAVLREFAAINPAAAPLTAEMGPIFPAVDLGRIREHLTSVDKQASEYVAKASPMLVVRMSARTGKKRRTDKTALIHVDSITAMLNMPIRKKIRFTEAAALVDILNADRALASRVSTLLRSDFIEQGEPLNQTSVNREIEEEDIDRLRSEFGRVNDSFKLRLVTSPERVVAEFMTELLTHLAPNFKSLKRFKERMQKIEQAPQEEQERRMGIGRAEKYIAELRRFFVDIPSEVVSAFGALGAGVAEKGTAKGRQGDTLQVYSGTVEGPMLQKTYVFSGSVNTCVKIASESVNLLVAATNLVRQWSEKASRFLTVSSAMEKAAQTTQIYQILKEESLLPVRAGVKLTEHLRRIVTGPQKPKPVEAAGLDVKPPVKPSAPERSKRPPASKTVIPMPKTLRGLSSALTSRSDSLEEDSDASIEPTVYYPCVRAGCANRAMKQSSFCGDACASKKKDQMLDTLLCWWKEDGCLFADAQKLTRARDFNAPSIKGSLELLDSIDRGVEDAGIPEALDDLRQDLRDVPTARIATEKKPNHKRARARESVVPIFARGLHAHTELAESSEVPAAAAVVAWDFELEIFSNSKPDGGSTASAEGPEDEKYGAKHRRLLYALSNRTSHVMGQIVNGGKSMKDLVGMRPAELKNLRDYKTSIVDRLDRKMQERQRPQKGAKDEPSKKRAREGADSKDTGKAARRKVERRAGGGAKGEKPVKAEEGEKDRTPKKKALSIKAEAGGSVKSGAQAPSNGSSSPATPTGQRSPTERTAIRAWSNHVEEKQESVPLEKLPTTYAVEYKGYPPFRAEIFVAQDELGAEDMLRTPLRLQGRVKLQAVSAFLNDIRAVGNRTVYHIRAANVPGEDNEKSARYDMLNLRGMEGNSHCQRLPL
uniref:PHD-type domain-containing protein n=1 Tax=Pinguiococcus pyrenoidosus TaxID=172671 RepID=A0A7R9YBK5_9STRA|mmetsp:Transcript_16618/g.63187  ORF Transcript_16618/g.63187 Transcript_16618/m.63187 type:complete len:1959 (+) Transcript_16618:263-6139(+)